MNGVNSTSCGISGNTLLCWYSDLHMLTFSHCLNSTSINYLFLVTKHIHICQINTENDGNDCISAFLCFLAFAGSLCQPLNSYK